MKKRNNTIYLVLFGSLSILNLFAEYSANTYLIYATKPLLMIVLSIYIYLETTLQKKYFKYILVAFIFSFFGDTFLMFVENDAQKAHFFLLGLGSFLITHLFYFLAFLSVPTAKKEGLLLQKKWLFIPFVLYLIGNTFFLWPDIPADLRIAVPIYSSMIVLMTMGALNLKPVLNPSIFKPLLLGVGLFVLSDSIIGLNKFKAHEIQLPYPRLLIMIPYLLGQYFIAKASVLYYNQLQH